MSVLRLSIVNDDALSVSAATTFPRWPSRQETVDTDDEDVLSSIRGIVAGAVLSLPVWVGVGVLAWKLVH